MIAMMEVCTPERLVVRPNMSPSFARVLPFAYERCTDECFVDNRAIINEYLTLRATNEFEQSQRTCTPPPCAKRKGGAACSETKRACYRPLHDANMPQPHAFAARHEPHPPQTFMQL